MELVIKPVATRRDLRDFIKLPARIHRDHTNWVPPIYSDEWTFFNPLKNRSFSYCYHIRLLAYRGQEPVGRIMGIINRKYNERKGENNARFNYLETYEDQEVVHALISAVEEWAKSLGTKKLVGPLGFSDKEPQGYLVDGLDQPISLVSTCNYEYQVRLLRNEGYEPEVNLVVYNAEIPDGTPPVYQRILPRLERLNKEFKMVEFTSRIKLRRYIYPVLHLTNRAFEGIYGAQPYDRKEMKDFANRFIWLLNPKLIKVIENKAGQVIAYVIGMPDITPGIRKSRGYLFPFGIFSILGAGRRSKQITMLLGAIDDPYRGRGLDVMMALRLFESARREGKRILDSHLVLESNQAMRMEYEHIGGQIVKRYQIFSKKL
ncbi:MAG: hypothetical protein R6V75_06615 [Bacteroidales bacterium]